ncbi:hypothetical protein BZA70DRAFT_270629, partial [Myxozyma melibiosi]
MRLFTQQQTIEAAPQQTICHDEEDRSLRRKTSATGRVSHDTLREDCERNMLRAATLASRASRDSSTASSSNVTEANPVIDLDSLETGSNLEHEWSSDSDEGSPLGPHSSRERMMDASFQELLLVFVNLMLKISKREEEKVIKKAERRRKREDKKREDFAKLVAVIPKLREEGYDIETRRKVLKAIITYREMGGWMSAYLWAEGEDAREFVEVLA